MTHQITTGKFMLLGYDQVQIFESVLYGERLRAIGLNYNSAPPIFKAWAKCEPYRAALTPVTTKEPTP